METLKNYIFDGLIKRAKLDTGLLDTDTIGMSYTYGNYCVSFYGKREDNFKLIVEDFCKFGSDGVKKFEPTPEQIEAMQYQLIKQLEIINEHNQQGQPEILDFYDYYGVKREHFY